MVNHEIRYADQIQCPGPAEVAAMVSLFPVLQVFWNPEFSA